MDGRVRIQGSRGILLTAPAFIEAVSSGEWFVCGGREARDLGKIPVTKVSLIGNTLKIETGCGVFELPSDRVIRVLSWEIEIEKIYLQKQQRKKVNGGGWHDVPVLRVALRLINPLLEQTIQQAQREEDERRRKEQERLENEVYEAKRQEYVEQLKSQFIGKKLAKIDVVDEHLCLEFDDSSKLSIKPAGGDGWDPVWIDVNEVSLLTFCIDNSEAI